MDTIEMDSNQNVDNAQCWWSFYQSHNKHMLWMMLWVLHQVPDWSRKYLLYLWSGYLAFIACSLSTVRTQVLIKVSIASYLSELMPMMPMLLPIILSITLHPSYNCNWSYNRCREACVHFLIGQGLVTFDHVDLAVFDHRSIVKVYFSINYLTWFDHIIGHEVLNQSEMQR